MAKYKFFQVHMMHHHQSQKSEYLWRGKQNDVTVKGHQLYLATCLLDWVLGTLYYSLYFIGPIS